MIAIFDRDKEQRLMLIAFLQQVIRYSNLKPSDRVSFLRFGGVGERVWEIESDLEGKLSAGDPATISLVALMEVANDSSQSIEELRCVHGGLIFGLSDASFLFFQSIDKELETKLGSEFQQVKVLSDQT